MFFGWQPFEVGASQVRFAGQSGLMHLPLSPTQKTFATAALKFQFCPGLHRTGRLEERASAIPIHPLSHARSRLSDTYAFCLTSLGNIRFARLYPRQKQDDKLKPRTADPAGSFETLDQ